MKIQNFMRVFMFLLEELLNSSSKELARVSFQSDEANTDRPLKEFIKKTIEKQLTCIPSFYKDNFLIVNGKFREKIKIGTFSSARVVRVYLPEELTNDIRQLIQERHHGAAYTNPDLMLEISMGGEVYYQSIELKSTKTDAIPGSSVQQINPYEWVIFVKHRNNFAEVTTGQYIHAVNSKLQFPDRSPRPQVSFFELRSWNAANRRLDRLSIAYNTNEDEEQKFELLNDWQGVLSKRWVSLLFDATTVRPNEPWFNNNMRRFILEFLEKYDNLSENEKNQFKNRIRSLIQE